MRANSEGIDTKMKTTVIGATPYIFAYDAADTLISKTDYQTKPPTSNTTRPTRLVSA